MSAEVEEKVGVDPVVTLIVRVEDWRRVEIRSLSEGGFGWCLLRDDEDHTFDHKSDWGMGGYETPVAALRGYASAIAGMSDWRGVLEVCELLDGIECISLKMLRERDAKQDAVMPGH